jgi:hypothetical protein
MVAPSKPSWADLQEEEEAAREARPSLLTLEMLPKLPRQAPGTPLVAARNLLLAVVAGKTTHEEAMRWSRNLPASAGSWVRRALLAHRRQQRERR